MKTKLGIMYVIIMFRGSIESRSTLLTVGLVILTTAAQSIHGTSFSESNSSGKECTTNPNISIVETLSHNAEVAVHLTADFKYLQTSMILSSCYFHNIIRGNRFITGKALGTSDADKTDMDVPLKLTYKTVNGIHAYHIAIETDIINFNDVINTSVKCGKFQGFRVKAVGATLCTLAEQKIENTLTDQMDKNTLPGERGWTNEEERKRKLHYADERTLEAETGVPRYEIGYNWKFNMQKLLEWVKELYAVTIYLILPMYALFLISRMFRSGGLIYEVLNARTKAIRSTQEDIV